MVALGQPRLQLSQVAVYVEHLPAIIGSEGYERLALVYKGPPTKAVRLTVHGLVHFSPVINGCCRACCGVHRSRGFIFRSP